MQNLAFVALWVRNGATYRIDSWTNLGSAYDGPMIFTNFVYLDPPNSEDYPGWTAPQKRAGKEKIYSVINNSVADCWIMLKFGMSVQYGSPKTTELSKSTFSQFQDGRLRPARTYSISKTAPGIVRYRWNLILACYMGLRSCWIVGWCNTELVIKAELDCHDRQHQVAMQC